jgi:hypothetical protein
VDGLLGRFPGLALRPSARRGELLIGGELEFSACEASRADAIEAAFEIEIRVPRRFPAALPEVHEVGGRVPPDFHTNPDGTLCLGAPLRLLLVVRKRPGLVGFVEGCVVPFLYAVVKCERGEPLPFGELAHGTRGLLDEYRAILGAKDDRVCVEMLRLVAMKKRVANKRPCPCGSGRRLGRCHHRRLNALRRTGPRSCLREATIGRLEASRPENPGMPVGSQRVRPADAAYCFSNSNGS